jgi:hypothetical protein
MSKHLEILRDRINGATARAVGEGMLQAVIVTDEDFVIGRAGFLGTRWGAQVERFPLKTLSDLRAVPNPSASLLQLEFDGPPPRSTTIMYKASASADFERIIALLREHLHKRQAGAA